MTKALTTRGWIFALFAALLGFASPAKAQQQIGDIKVCYYCANNFSLNGTPLGLLDGPTFLIENTSTSDLTNAVFIADGDPFVIGTIPAMGSVVLIPGISNDNGPNHTFWAVTGGINDTSDNGPEDNSTPFVLVGDWNGGAATTGIFTPGQSIQAQSNDGTVTTGINFLGGPNNSDAPCNDCYGPDVVATINAFPAFACTGTSGTRSTSVYEPAAKVHFKAPVVKAVSFGKMALGTSASQVTTLTNVATTALQISQVKVIGADFKENNGCQNQALAPGASCDISIVFAPKHPGVRRGTLSLLASGVKVTAGLSGIGQAPAVQTLTPNAQAAFSQVTLAGTGFAPTAPLLVSFAEHLAHGKPGPSFVVAAVRNPDSSITAVVPPVLDPKSGEPVAGTATVIVQELISSSSSLSSRSPGGPLKIAPPAVSTNLQPGVVTQSFLEAEQTFASQLTADVQISQLGTADVVNSLNQVASQSSSLLTALTSGGTPSLGTIAGVNVTVGQAALTTADNQLLSMLQTLAGSSAPASMRRRGTAPALTAGTGCLAAEAATALNDAEVASPDPGTFENDITNLLDDSLNSPACQQPAAAIVAEGIIGRASGAALAVLNQAGFSGVGGGVPSQAVSFGTLGPIVQLIGLGLALDQTSSQAEQEVVDGLNTFNSAIAPQLSKVVQHTQSGSTLQGVFSGVSQATTSIAQAAPPFDGNYAGTFTGELQLAAGGFCPIGSTLNFSASGSTITAVAPGSGAGTLNSDGSASFTVAGVGGTATSCTFGGDFAIDTTGGASASGTWSCAAPAGAAGFTSANGTWSAMRQ
jgi:hypothetical protein